jgi:predicted homoserine dehydrogenase-like protein
MIMTPTKEQIEAAAVAYGSGYAMQEVGFVDGANWALQQLPQWISVEERLPDLGKRVIVEYKPDQPIMEGTIIKVDERIYTKNLPGELRKRIDARNGFRYYNVVRWQELPAK